MEQPSWKTLSSEVKYENRWIRVVEDQVINPGGQQGIYGKVHFKNTAIGIVPIDAAGNTWLVGQHRYVLDAWSWEIPEGGCPDSDFRSAAIRELQEETGLNATRWTEVLRLHLSNSVSDELGIIYLAEDLSEGVTSRESSEADMKIWKLPLKEALSMVDRGQITDSMSIAGLMKAGRMRGLQG